MKTKRVLLAALFAVTVCTAAFSGEWPEDVPRNDTVEIIDYYRRSVTISGPVLRVVSLSPGITETIFALGFGDRLVGRTEFCDFPEQALEVPVVGSLIKVDAEAVLALNPDLIIASTHFPKEELEILTSAGLETAVFKGQESFEGTYDGVIRPVARVLGNPEAGEVLIRRMERTVAEAKRRAASIAEPPVVYYAVSFGEGGDWTAGGDTFIGEMIEMAGGRNAAREIQGWSYSLEALVDADPDIIIVPPWAVDLFPRTPIYSDLAASRAGRVFAIDENIIVRQGPRLADGFDALTDIIASTF